MKTTVARALVAAAGLAVAAAALAQLDLSRSENWVLTTATVDGAALRVYADRARGVTCYFWRASLSCVRDAKP